MTYLAWIGTWTKIPDVCDFDNDGDGVPDNADISPNDFQVVKDNQLFKLDLVGAQTAKDLLVDLQIRPQDDTHLSWTNSILDWPDNDNRGQLQRMTPTPWAKASGDIQLMPMLEITIPYSRLTQPAACRSRHADYHRHHAHYHLARYVSDRPIRHERPSGP